MLAHRARLHVPELSCSARSRSEQRSRAAVKQSRSQRYELVIRGVGRELPQAPYVPLCAHAEAPSRPLSCAEIRAPCWPRLVSRLTGTASRIGQNDARAGFWRTGPTDLHEIERPELQRGSSEPSAFRNLPDCAGVSVPITSRSFATASCAAVRARCPPIPVLT